MENLAHQLRRLLRLAAELRAFAAAASRPDYARKLLGAAMELEAQAEFLAGQRTGFPSSGPNPHEASHAPVDIRV